jgi:hypothetical protein
VLSAPRTVVIIFPEFCITCPVIPSNNAIALSVTGQVAVTPSVINPISLVNDESDSHASTVLTCAHASIPQSFPCSAIEYDAVVLSNIALFECSCFFATASLRLTSSFV